MPMTHAERQRNYRNRQAEQLAALEAEAADLRADLEAAVAEIERLSASQCKHPAGAVDGSHCRACGTDLW